MSQAEMEDLPFTPAELSEMKGLYSSFWGQEDHSQHALFQDTLPTDLSADPTLSALQTLTEEELRSGAEILRHWREAGNQLYKDVVAFEKLGNTDMRRRRLRDALSAYDHALRAECDDHEQKSAIHANRALCLFKLGEYAKSVDEAKYAIVKNAKNVKGYFHAARGCLAMSLHKRALSFVEEAFHQLPPEDCVVLTDLRTQLQNTLAKRKHQVEQRVEEQAKARNLLARVLKAREIDWRSHSPYTAPLGMPQITENKLVAWPILILIDEYSVSEGIDLVEESASVRDIIAGLFGGERFGWDVDHKYRPGQIQLSVWRGDSNSTFDDIEDEDLPLCSVLPMCQAIHQFLVMKARPRHS